MSQRSLKDATITLSDGATTANEITIKVGEGNISWSERRNIEYSRDRGLLSGGDVRELDEEPCELRFDFIWEWVGSESGTSISQAIKGSASWTSTSDDVCEPFAVDLVIAMEGCGSGVRETITFPDFRYDSLDYDLRAGSVSCVGRCKATSPTVV